jgi:predicted TIM-barrel fold metal-dependent hydrolase
MLAEAMTRNPVVDCDSHVMEPPDLWLRYLEPEYRARAIRIELVDGVERLLIGEEVVLQGVLAGLGGANLDRAQVFSGALRYTDGCPPASFDPLERAKLLDEWGVDAGVIFPTIGILPFPSDDLPLSSAYCRAYNRWQYDFARAIPGRALPIAALELRDLDGARRELDWCLAHGFRGVFLPPELIGAHRPGSAVFDSLWARCAEAGAPLCLHVIVRFGGAARPFPAWLDSAPGPIFSFAMGGTGQIVPALASMVLDGVFDRHPSLKLVAVEAGCGWAAYAMDRLDEKYAHFAPLAPKLELRPSEYFKRNCYFVAEPEERTIGSMLELVGEDRILWGSDYPHVDSSLDAPRQIRASLAPLSAERRAAVLGGNAAKLFRL